MRFLVGNDLATGIRNVLAAPEVRCAVAFWGRGAEVELSQSPGQAMIICNLKSGGTNPNVLVDLISAGHCLRQNDRLHAKVYLCATSAVIASANASANGLNFEGAEGGGWIEAGFWTSDVDPIVRWFEEIWISHETRSISEVDLVNAAALWRQRRSVRPTLSSFADFDPCADDLPLVVWWDYTNDEVTNQAAVEMATGLLGAAAKKAVDDGIPIEHKSEREILSPGVWSLWWQRDRRNGVPTSARLEWKRCGQVLPQALIVDRGTRNERTVDVVRNDLINVPVPFDCNEAVFEKIFRNVIAQCEFDNLRAGYYQDSFIAPRVRLMRTFWGQLHEQFPRPI